MAGTSARTTVQPGASSGSVPSTRPRRPDRSPSTVPRCSSGARTATSSNGSSRLVWPVAAASLSASAPAVWKAASEESTLCALPSTRVTRTSTTGQPGRRPRSSRARTPFSTLGMNWCGTAPPTIRSTNSKPAPRGSGSTSMSHTAYWPCPPDCLTCRPCPLTRAVNVSRSGTRIGSVSTSAPPARSRLSTTSAWASPMHHSTSWWVSGLRSSRSVGSLATSRPRLRARVSSSCLLYTYQGRTSSGSAGSDTVSPVSAEPSLVTAHTSPATQQGTSCRAEPRGE